MQIVTAPATVLWHNALSFARGDHRRTVRPDLEFVAVPTVTYECH